MLSHVIDGISQRLMKCLMKSYRSVQAEKMALVVLDTQPANLENQHGLQDRLKNLIRGCRKAGVTVIFSDFGGKRASENLPLGVEKLFEQYESNNSGILPELAAQKSDIVLSERTTLSVFFDESLQSFLAERGIEHLVFVGGFVELSVQSSARHSSELGYHTTVLSDCCGYITPQSHKASMEVTLPRMVHDVLTADQWLKKIRTH